MKKVRGVYKDGVVQLLENPGVEGQKEVYILFPDEPPGEEKVRFKGMACDPTDLKPLSGVVSLGGDSVEDTERYYD
jgi:hypothetical protein